MQPVGDVEKSRIFAARKETETMYWIIVVIVFAIIAVKETRKERKNAGYRSWMSDDSGCSHKYDWWWW